MKRKRIAVIGGGVSGIAAAIRASQNGHEVTIYEHTDSPGKKLLITGNGKCNFSNRDAGLEHYHSSSDRGNIAGVFSRFPAEDTLAFFESLGLCIKEKDGRIYPVTDSSRTVLEILKLELKRLSVGLELKRDIKSLDPDGVIEGKRYDVLIVAAGGLTFKNTGSDGSGLKMLRDLGVDVIKPLPALTPVPVKEEVSSLKGVRCRARVSLFTDGSFVRDSVGELQPYERGMSGICAMDVSGQAARALYSGKKAEIECDLFPELSDEGLEEHLRGIMSDHPERNLKEVLCGLFAGKLINHILHPVDTRRDDFLKETVKRIKHLRFTVDENIVKDFDKAQVISGGVSFEEMGRDLELKRYPNIRVCGELLDVYGDCGGYNLQWAFSSGFTAGDIK